MSAIRSFSDFKFQPAPGTLARRNRSCYIAFRQNALRGLFRGPSVYGLLAPSPRRR